MVVVVVVVVVVPVVLVVVCLHLLWVLWVLRPKVARTASRGSCCAGQVGPLFEVRLCQVEGPVEET